MKKTIMLLSAAALVFAACQKEEGSIASINGLKLTATIEQQDSGSETKTYLEDLQVKWSTGDQVNVFTDAATPEKLTLTLSAGDSTTSGTFTTGITPSGNPQYAIYPASDDNSIDDSTITFTLPATQNYVENSFDNGANVAVGKVSGASITYKNVCGVLKLNLKGDITVSKIELSGNNEENLYGTFTINAANVGDGATYSTGGGTTLTLDCGDDGVELSNVQATKFYFVVPVGAFGDNTNPGFTAKVYEKSLSNTYDVETTSANVISRSRIKAMPNCWIVDGGVYVLPSAYQEVEYLQSSGTQYINTGVTGNLETAVEIKFANTQLERTSVLFGSRQSATEANLSILSPVYWRGYTNNAAADFGDYQLTRVMTENDVSINDIIIAYNSKSSRYIQNTTTGVLYSNNTACSTYFETPTNLYIGYKSSYYEFDGINFIGKIYYCKLWNNCVLVRNFIPCYCKSGTSYTDGNTGLPSGILSADKLGMYDLVSGSFFVNQGTGDDFTTGPAVTY